MNLRWHCFNAGLAALTGAFALLALSLPAEANVCSRHPELCQPQPADMACISKSPNFVEELETGQSVDRTWQVCVENVGGSTATNAVIMDTLPAGVEFLASAGCVEGPPGTVTCALGDVPKASGQICVDINVRFSSNTPPGTNVAQVTADNDANAGNNNGPACTATVEVTEIPPPQPNPVCIIKEADPQSIEEGVTTEVLYTILVENTGLAASDTNEFAVQDDLPADCDFVEAFDSFGDPCVENLGQVECLLPGLVPAAVDSDTEITVSCSNPTETSDLLNRARVIRTLDDVVFGDDCERDLQVIPQVGDEGCTPGFLRQDQHVDSWPAGLADDLWTDWFNPTSEPAIDTATLFDATSLGGGGLFALARHAAAALANSESPDVDYSLTTPEIIDLVNNAIESGDANVIDAAKNQLDEANNQGCPLS